MLNPLFPPLYLVHTLCVVMRWLAALRYLQKVTRSVGAECFHAERGNKV